jgi:putative peptidoglycan lipid II flippase
VGSEASTHQPVQSLIRAALRGAGLLTLGMIVVRLAGLMRGVVVAGRFGLGDDLAAFLLGLVLVGLCNSLLGDALRECFIARYWTGFSQEASEGRGGDFWPIVLQGSAVGAGVMLLLWFGYPWLMAFLGRNMAPETVMLAIQLARACIGVILLQLWAGFFDALLQANHRYASSGITPALVPLFTILVLWLIPSHGIWALVWGYYLGLLFRILILAFAARDLIPPLRGAYRNLRSPGLWSLWRFQAAAATVASLNLAVDRMMGAGLGAQSLAALDFGMTLSHIIERFCMVSLMTALLPGMSDSWGRGERATVKAGLRRTSEAFALLLPPISIAIALSAREIISILYQRGGFTPQDTLRTAPILALYALGWLPLAWTYLASRGCLVTGRMRVLWPVAAYELVANLALNSLFIRWFGAPGIAGATSLLYVGSAIWLGRYLVVRTGMDILGPGLKLSLRIAPAMVAQIVVMWVLAEVVWPWQPEDVSLWMRGIRLGVTVGAGMLLFLLLAWFPARREINFWLKAIGLGSLPLRKR